MRILIKRYVFLFILVSNLHALYGYDSKVGSAGITLTPKGSPNWDNVDVVSTPSKNLKMSFQKAKELLLSTNVVTYAKLGQNMATSDQMLALASIIYSSKSPHTINLLEDIFNNASYDEGKIYALFGLYHFNEMNLVSELSSSLDKQTPVNFFTGKNLYKTPTGELLNAFHKKPELFIAQSSCLVLNTTRVYNYPSVPAYYYKRPNKVIIINPNKNDKK